MRGISFRNGEGRPLRRSQSRKKGSRVRSACAGPLDAQCHHVCLPVEIDEETATLVTGVKEAKRTAAPMLAHARDRTARDAGRRRGSMRVTGGIFVSSMREKFEKIKSAN